MPIEMGFADYSELKAAGIKSVIDLGRNGLDLREKVITLEDGSQWDYMEEDNIYERRQGNYITEVFDY